MNTLRRVLQRGAALLGYFLICVLIWAKAAEPLWVILAWLPFSFGLLCGFALAVVAGTLWVFVAGPTQEWVLERFFDPPQPPPPLIAPTDGRPQGVLVSDLHIDTWGLLTRTNRRSGARGFWGCWRR